MKTTVHVNRNAISDNASARARDRKPVFTVEHDSPQGRVTREGDRVVISGPSELIYHHRTPLKNGALAWLQTDAEVTVFYDGSVVE